MASLGALERLQKFDWLIQRLHSLRTPLSHNDKNFEELRKLQSLQMLQKPDLMFHHAGEGHSEDMEEEDDLVEQDPVEDIDDEDLVDEEIIEDDYDKDEDENEKHDSSRSEAMMDAFSNERAEGQDESIPDSTSVSKSSYFPFQHRYEYNKAEQSNGMSRFSTGLFPPLPFKDILPLLENTGLKVGTINTFL